MNFVVLKLFATKMYYLIIEDRNLLEKSFYSVRRTRKWRGRFGKLHNEGAFNSKISVTSENDTISRCLKTESIVSKELPLELHFNLISEIIAKLRVSIFNILPPTKEIPQEWELTPVYR